jgi:hypothetical protein
LKWSQVSLILPISLYPRLNPFLTLILQRVNEWKHIASHTLGAFCFFTMSTATLASKDAKEAGTLKMVDIEYIQKKYKEEREKRLDKARTSHYTPTSGALKHFEDDPYTNPIQRDPVREQRQIVIIGGGFGGLLTAVRLIQAGIMDIRIIEKAGDFGGTWYWNRYPGAG